MGTNITRDREWGKDAAERPHTPVAWDEEGQPVLDIGIGTHGDATERPMRIVVLNAVQ